jgi:anti-sigma B factor antagonist
MILLTIRTMPPEITVVELSGRLALGNSLREAEDKIKTLIGAGSKKVIVDLSKIELTDSAGIGMLMMCHSTAATADGAMRITGANERVLSVLRMTHVDKILSLFDSTENAAAGF